MKIILESTITCPVCQHIETENMPINACEYFYNCKSCGELLKAQNGDCCVFCTYGNTPCPSIQEKNDCCK